MTIDTSPKRPAPVAQWLSVAVTIVVSLALAVALPRVADNSIPEATALTAGERVEAGGISVVPPEGWSLAGGSDIFILSKDDSTLVISEPAKDPRGPVKAIEDAEKLFTEDKTAHATFGDVATFTTDSGLSAASVTVGEHDAITALSAFSDGTLLANGTLSTTPATYATLAKDLDAILATLEFTDGSAA